MSRQFKIISPVNGEVVAERFYATDEAVENVLEESQKAFHSWKKTSISQRMKVCRKAVDFFLENVDELSMELTMQMGRPIKYAPFEINNGFKERAEYMITIAEKALSDQKVSEKDGFIRFIRREPLGTVLVLAPWNYPYLTSVNAVIPSIMAGNSVILKHAKQTALCAERYSQAFAYAGLPKGVFQYLHIDHEQVSDLIGDSRIGYTAFTGSVECVEAIQKAIGSRVIAAGLELGGKDPAYVAEDADLGNAIENLVDGAFFNSGQSCCGIERIYVHRKLYDDFIKGFVELTKKYVLGDPTDLATTLGPMVRVKNAQYTLDQIEDALSKGAKKLIDPGDFPNLELPYLAPQVLVDVNHGMDIMTEETFGPVVGIMPVDDEAQAIELMNDSNYGLTASIWTKDMEKAIRIGSQIDTGTWFMNRCDYLDPELAWTGVKNSGKGCTLSALGYDYLTRPKSFHLKLK